MYRLGRLFRVFLDSSESDLQSKAGEQVMFDASTFGTAFGLRFPQQKAQLFVTHSSKAEHHVAVVAGNRSLRSDLEALEQ